MHSTQHSLTTITTWFNNNNKWNFMCR